jgi:hypothetical protein
MTQTRVPQDGANLAELADASRPAATLEVCRGTIRLLAAHGLACVTELPLANGRRADIVGLSASGEISIVEVKSSIEDFRSDLKWPDYREFCDRLFFSVRPDFPIDVLPIDTGLILADRYSGEIVRPAPEMPLAGARRKAMTLRFARAAAVRFSLSLDPALLL